MAERDSSELKREGGGEGTEIKSGSGALARRVKQVSHSFYYYVHGQSVQERQESHAYGVCRCCKAVKALLNWV